MSASSGSAQFLPRIGMVLIAAADDHAWGSAGVSGLRAVESLGLARVSLHDRVPPESWEDTFSALAAEGCTLVLGHGGELSESICRAAQSHPHTRFACLNGAHTAQNLAILAIDDAQLAYLAGALAAHVSASQKVGFVGGLSIPPTRAQAAGFTAGAQSALAQAHVAFTGDFNDSALARQAALDLIRQGADVLYYYLNEAWHGVLQACAEQGCRAVASVVDRRADAPAVVCASVLQHIDRVYLAAARLALAGRLEGRRYTFGLEAGAGSLTPLQGVSADVITHMAALERALAAGEIRIS